MAPPVAGKASIVRRGGARLLDVKSCETTEDTRSRIKNVLRRRSALSNKAHKCIIRGFLHKVTNKMASNEPAEDSMKSSVTDISESVTDVSELKIDQTKSPITPSINEDNELNNVEAVKVEDKKDPILEQNNTTEEKKDTVNIEDKNKHNLRSLVTDKNEQDDKKENQEQDVKEEIKQQETENIAMSPHPQDVNTKDLNNEDKDLVKDGGPLKRKRKSQSSSMSPIDSPVEESGTRSKRKKNTTKNTNDKFCWRCHKETVDVYCTACPRSWHRKCIGGMPPSSQKWICGECVTILTAENAETRSSAMAQLSVEQLCVLLKNVVERLREYPGSEPFCKPVNLVEVPNYLNYVIKPMDLSLLESNVRSKLYGSTDAFMADAKWIQHNCIVFNTCGGVYADVSKLTNTAKQIIKCARSDISEIEACPDCYAHSRNLPRTQPTWFIEPCRRPHPLVWAKLKGFPFWPAKAMPRVNSQGFVDVRFFGEHARAWVAPKDIYLYSEEPPTPSSRKRKSEMDECVREITRHCRKLELIFGQFKFAPPKVQYNPNDPMQITLLLPNYNPTDPENRLINSVSPESKKKIPPRKRSLHKDKLQHDESVNDDNGEPNASKENINGDNQEKENDVRERKVQKLDFDAKVTPNSQSNLNDNHSELNEKVNQEIGKVAQNKIAESGAKRTKTPVVKSNENDNALSPDKTTADKSNSQEEKNEKKPVTEQPSISPRKSLNMMRVRKKSVPKNAAKWEASPNTPKSTQKNAKSDTAKSYKPKKQMVDKLNAEKALKSISVSKENNRLTMPNASGPATKRLSLGSKAKNSASSKKISEIDVTLSQSAASIIKNLPRIEPRPIIQSTDPQSSVSFVPSKDPKSVLLLVVNKDTAPEAAKQKAATDYLENKDTLVAVQREAKDTHDSPPQKKESKAKKSFPNKSSDDAQINSRTLTTTTAEFPVQVSISKSNTFSNASFSESSCTSSKTYQMLPPEAGPISARLHHNTQELARRIGQLMEEAYKEAAEAETVDNGENSTADNYQATVFFLRMQIEHMKWQHQQQMAELQHNADRTMREMRASLEAEKLRSIQEARREVEEDKIRCIEETKRKQWCAKCGQEALFYCCWNTAYCDYPCQQLHWSTHMHTCSQQLTTIVKSSSSMNANSQVQVMPRLVFNATSDVRKA
ncbi:protein kinase C-binding protein 1 isoform X2 [Odontomachus brunneus]|uniref:protein kinase C-binding protein 1 isoform X2 n=1 Tax=Odontomachus brunneus TaxID=486640 RepID=UPI0013F2451E|nr:protein kinase C-binding protein 1 isoform X2 [Odontomachus brunneus]